MLRYRNKTGMCHKERKLAGKPGSVGALRLPTAIPLGPGLLQGSSHLPASSAGRVVACLLGVAPGGGCRVSPRRALRSGTMRHRTPPFLARYVTAPTHFFETLPPFGGEVRSAAPGGLVSVALFLASRRTAVNRHPTLWSPDFPLRIATIRSGRLASFRQYFTSRSTRAPELATARCFPRQKRRLSRQRRSLC